MSLHIHHAAQLLPLAGSLAMVLQTPLADPFEAEVVGVPTVGVRDWLQQQLALRLGAGQHQDGIAANIDMVFLNRFTAAALGQPTGVTSPWDLEQLTWTVLRVLHRATVDVPGWRARRRHDADDVSASGTYATARRIADLFDRYANHRPQLLQQWAAGRFGDGTVDERGAVTPLPADHIWQANLWRAVREHIGQPTLAERLPELVDGLSTGQFQPALPDRVSVFGLSAVSAGQLTVFRALAEVRDVHLHLLHPSPAAWESCRQQLAGELVLRSAVDATAAVRHPLLRSWARPPMETAALVGGLGGATIDSLDHAGADSTKVQSTTLHRLQADVLLDQPPTSADAVDAVDATDAADGPTNDRSIQIHACHGTTRQLETMRDALGHLFAADSTLAPHDVLILCPDLHRFAPLIQSVFQRSSFPVPVRVSDLSIGADNAVASALDILLTTIAGRCTGPDVMQLLAQDPVHRMFGFGDQDAERISGWIDQLGTTWGLDSTHRGEWVPAHIVEGTWRATLDRLLLGAAMPAPSSRVGPGAMVPFDDVDAAGLTIAGRLAELIHRLITARALCARQHSIARWVDIVTGLITDFFATHPDDTWQIAAVVEAIAAVSESAADSDVPLSFSDARSVVASVLTEDRGRLALRSGSVTATTLLPVRNLPARVVCLLGLDDNALRSAGTDGDDILGLRPCVGERDQRVEGRHMLLDAVMSAGDHVVVTYDGSDITTNRTLPPPVHLSELLDVVAATTGATPNSLITVHPRQAFDERNLTSTPGSKGPDGFATGQSFTFDAAMLGAAMARRTATPAITPWPLLHPIVPVSLDLAALAEACIRPDRTFMSRRLDARMPTEVDQSVTSIPLRFVGLDQYQLGSELLELHRSGADETMLQAWGDAHRLSGALPPRALAEAVLAEAVTEVDLVLDGSPDARTLLASANGEQPVEIELSVPELHRATVPLRDVVRRIHGDQLIRVNFTRPGPRATISVAIELAALIVTEPGRDWSALVINRPKSAAASKATIDRPRPIDGPERVPAAIHLLRAALSFHLRALREPLPYFANSSLTLFETRTIDDDEFIHDIRSDPARFLWGANTADDILAIPLRATDEMAAIADSPFHRAQALADLMWMSYHRFIAPPPASGDGSVTDSESEMAS
ncbi:MAG: exodeoxyribonuclease V subunit gamma [Ilumatobacteraceae bacterium]